VIPVLATLSNKLATVERWVLIFLALAVTALILLNVVTRSFQHAIYWVDELAIYSMIWLVMFGASASFRSRDGIAVTLLQGVVGERIWSVMQILVDCIKLLFAIALIWLSWIWYDPLTLAAHDFDIRDFSGNTFNFLYDEPTLTIGIPKFIVWLVMPITAVTMTIHAAANLFAQRDAATVDVN